MNLRISTFTVTSPVLCPPGGLTFMILAGLLGSSISQLRVKERTEGREQSLILSGGGESADTSSLMPFPPWEDGEMKAKEKFAASLFSFICFGW